MLVAAQAKLSNLLTLFAKLKEVVSRHHGHFAATICCTCLPP